MNITALRRLAAGLAVGIGVMSMGAGGSVLLDVSRPAYDVLMPLVAYNAVMGAVSVAVGIGLLQAREAAGRAAWGIVGLHGLVFLGLVGWAAAGGVVAAASIGAMAFRTLVWSLIAVLALRAATGGRGHGQTSA